MDEAADLRQAAVGTCFPITGQLAYKMRSGITAGLKHQCRLGFQPVQVSEEQEFLARLAPALNGKTVYDIGPCVGAFATFFELAIGSDGTLVTFEPTARPHSGVDVKGLDDFVKTGACPAPDFIRIDVGGAELGVVRGARSTIRHFHPAMYIAMHGANLKEKLAQQREMHQLLHNWGYEIEDLAGRNAFGAERHVERILCTHPTVPSHILFLGFAPRTDTPISVIS